MTGRRLPPAALTRQGMALAGLGLLVALAAANTGANLLFLVLGLAVGTFAVSWRASGRVLREAQVELRLPALVAAGADLPGVLRVQRGGTGTGARRGPASLWLFGETCLPASGVLATLAGGAPAERPFLGTAPARGVVRAVDVELRTRAPYHLLERRRRLTLPVEVHVHPRLAPAGRSSASGAVARGSESQRAGSEGGIRNLRTWSTGDNPRHIHWRATARRAHLASPLETLVVREFHGEQQPEIVIALDTTCPPGPAFEAAVAAAASSVRDVLVRDGAVELRSAGARLRYSGLADLGRALRWFASVTASPRPEASAAEASAASPAAPEAGG